jgi:hypothetical protein
MKISSRFKQIVSVAIVSVLAATIMPSTASADPENFDDNVVTVEVNLGTGPGDEGGCEGFATIELPDNTIPASFNGRELGNANPTAVDYLYWEYGTAGDTETFTDNDLQNFLTYLTDSNWSPVTTPESATVSNLEYISYVTSDGTNFVSYDRNEDGRIDGADSPEWITETRRTYSTDWFEISYDASDCDDSQEMAFVLAGRGPVLRQVASPDWDIADIDLLDEVSATSIVNRGSASLRLDTRLLGGLVSLPYKLADYPVFYQGSELDPWDYDPVSWGSDGTASMKALMDIYGSSPSGKYRTNFYYQLEVNEQEYFEGIPFFGCFLGPC